VPIRKEVNGFVRAVGSKLVNGEKRTSRRSVQDEVAKKDAKVQLFLNIISGHT